MQPSSYSQNSSFTVGRLTVQVWTDSAWNGGPAIAGPNGLITVFPPGFNYFNASASQALTEAMGALFSNNPALAQAIGHVDIFVTPPGATETFDTPVGPLAPNEQGATRPGPRIMAVRSTGLAVQGAGLFVHEFGHIVFSVAHVTSYPGGGPPQEKYVATDPSEEFAQDLTTDYGYGELPPDLASAGAARWGKGTAQDAKIGQAWLKSHNRAGDLKVLTDTVGVPPVLVGPKPGVLKPVQSTGRAKLVRVPSWTEGRERSAGKTRSVAW
jgi:hypothetical protein